MGIEIKNTYRFSDNCNEFFDYQVIYELSKSIWITFEQSWLFSDMAEG